jgi:hypothetical protein
VSNLHRYLQQCGAWAQLADEHGRVSKAARQGTHMLIPSDSYDVDYPLEVDDEFWSTGDPATDFVQPANKPSKISVFVSLVKLVKIISRAMKVIVSDKGYSAKPNMQLTRFFAVVVPGQSGCE